MPACSISMKFFFLLVQVGAAFVRENMKQNTVC